MEFLTNPWVISIVIVSVVIGNIAALKYTANMKFGKSQSVKDIDKLTKQTDENNQQNTPDK
ncbi:hypothetical protein MACH09_07220 [Vibrio sp. MACH09]|uniref:DUF2897 family protein n=1 Tax=unclassified Vibrio TaxID=2614977 RepID=UPI001493D549|nr:MULTISPECIES: DUF2897 family protein [unclassified Vibrio]NOI66644.1 DUF2897 family protein [Vibrio sp. 99-8-1]GLO60214.1 hypothetical protein MACH09_07220 [Vibrio sp. MACH09]